MMLVRLNCETRLFHDCSERGATMHILTQDLLNIATAQQQGHWTEHSLQSYNFTSARLLKLKGSLSRANSREINYDLRIFNTIITS